MNHAQMILAKMGMLGMNDLEYCRSCMRYRAKDCGKYKLVGSGQKQFKCGGCLAQMKKVKPIK